MRLVTFLTAVTTALFALAACAPTAAPTGAPTTAIGRAPTLGPTETAVAPATASSTAPAATAAATPAAGPAPAQTITVIGTEFKFDPNQLTVKSGQRVRIVFQNTGATNHELEVEGLKADNVVLDMSQAGSMPENEMREAMDDAASGVVHEHAAAGGTATVDFTPTTAGTYTVACNLPGHREAGMVGTMVVQP